jgi:hypothetical protein
VIGIFHATFSFETLDESIWLTTSRVPSEVALGSDHSGAATAALVVAAVVVDDRVAGDVADAADGELDVLLVDVWPPPPHAAIATLTATAPATTATRHDLVGLIVCSFACLKSANYIHSLCNYIYSLCKCPARNDRARRSWGRAHRTIGGPHRTTS